MKKAVFLDRDGVIINNSIHYYIYKTEDIQFIDEIFENLKLLQQKSYLLFIVSNQGGISKGIYTKSDVELVHKKMLNEFNKHSIKITDIIYCPHHPDNELCLCRKPSPIMIEKLISKYQIDRKNSYFIGDSITDIEAAKNANIHGIKIIANQSMKPFITEL